MDSITLTKKKPTNLVKVTYTNGDYNTDDQNFHDLPHIELVD